MPVPRDDAKTWSKKVDRIIKEALGKEELKKELDEEYHSKVLEKIRKGRTKQA